MLLGVSGIPLPAQDDTVSVLTSMAQEAAVRLRERGETIVAETSTGGLIFGIACSTGASAYYKGKRLYTFESRKKLLCITRPRC